MSEITLLHGFFQSDDNFAFDRVFDDGVEVLFYFQELDDGLVELLSDLLFPLFLGFFAGGMGDMGFVFA